MALDHIIILTNFIFKINLTRFFIVWKIRLNWQIGIENAFEAILFNFDQTSSSTKLQLKIPMQLKSYFAQEFLLNVSLL